MLTRFWQTFKICPIFVRSSFKTNISFYFFKFQETWDKLSIFSFPGEEVMGPSFWRTLYKYRPNICQPDSLSKQIKVSIFLFSVFQETWYKFIDLFFPKWRSNGTKLLAKVFFSSVTNQDVPTTLTHF